MTFTETFELLFKRVTKGVDWSAGPQMCFGRCQGGTNQMFTRSGVKSEGKWPCRPGAGGWNPHKMFGSFRRGVHTRRRRHGKWRRKCGFNGFSANKTPAAHRRSCFDMNTPDKRAILCALSIALQRFLLQPSDCALSSKECAANWLRAFSLSVKQLLYWPSPQGTTCLKVTYPQWKTASLLSPWVHNSRYYHALGRPNESVSNVINTSQFAIHTSSTTGTTVSELLPSLLTVYADGGSRGVSVTLTSSATQSLADSLHGSSIPSSTLINSFLSEGDRDTCKIFNEEVLPLPVTSLAESAVVDFPIPSLLQGASVSTSLSDESPRGLLTQIRSHIAHLQSIAKDIESISTLGDLPFSIELDGTMLRVHFPNSDAESVNYLLQDKEVKHGLVSEVAIDVSDLDEPVVPLLATDLSETDTSGSDPTPGLSFSDCSETLESSLSTVTESWFSMASV